MPHERHHGFWDWLFGDDVPEDDRGWDHTNLQGGRTALSVLVRNEAEREQVADILEEFDPVQMNEATPGGIGGATSFRPEIQRDAVAARSSDQMRTGPAGTPEPTEEVIPVVKEELAVGKRASEHRYRIRTYVVETVQHGAGSGRNSVDVGSHGDLPRVRRQPVEPHAGRGEISGG